MHPDLQSLLQQRLAIIADRELYQRDPAAHLEALKDVSEKIHTYSETRHADLDAKLRHYLANASYQKALDHIS